jgi:hypothetical protein
MPCQVQQSKNEVNTFCGERESGVMKDDDRTVQQNTNNRKALATTLFVSDDKKQAARTNFINTEHLISVLRQQQINVLPANASASCSCSWMDVQSNIAVATR